MGEWSMERFSQNVTVPLCCCFLLTLFSCSNMESLLWDKILQDKMLLHGLSTDFRSSRKCPPVHCGILHGPQYQNYFIYYIMKNMKKRLNLLLQAMFAISVICSWISIMICLCSDLKLDTKQAWEAESINELFGQKYLFVVTCSHIFFCPSDKCRPLNSLENSCSFEMKFCYFVAEQS